MKIREEIVFDYQLTDKPKEEITLRHRTFGEDGSFYFKGTRAEVKDFIVKNNPELYEKCFIYTTKGKSRDWFAAMSTEFIVLTLRYYGFNWQPVYTVIRLIDEKNLEKNEQNFYSVPS